MKQVGSFRDASELILTIILLRRYVNILTKGEACDGIGVRQRFVSVNAILHNARNLGLFEGSAPYRQRQNTWELLLGSTLSAARDHFSSADAADIGTYRQR